jgi:hypothetical protein
MNGLDQIGITGEGLQGRRLIGLQEVANVGLLRIEGGELKPGQRILEVPSDSLDGIELWAIRRQEHQAHVRGEDQSLGGRCPTVIEEQDIETGRDSLCERVHERLKHRRIQMWQVMKNRATSWRLWAWPLASR